MTDTTVVTEAPAKPKRKYTRRKAAPQPRTPKAKGQYAFLAGITATACPTNCMKDGACVISTVSVCKHPFKAGDTGCGPITAANRRLAMKLLKHRKIDLTE